MCSDGSRTLIVHLYVLVQQRLVPLGHIYLHNNIAIQVSEHQSNVCHNKVSSAIMGYLEHELFSMADMLCCEAASAQALFQRVPVSIDFRRLQKYGVHMTKEPFFRSMLLAIHRYNIS